MTFFEGSASARVFDFKNEHLATYFKGNIGSSALDKSQYAKSSGASTTFTAAVPYNLGGEFGILLASESLGLRIGIEGVSPKRQDGIEGKNESGKLLMNLTSSVIALIPSVHLEYYLEPKPSRRFFISGGAGTASVNVVNSYVLTTDGIAAYPGISDFTEELASTALMTDISTGIEFSFSDNVTMLADVGYRYLIFPSFKHSRDATTFNGAVLKGDVALDSAGSKRSLNMSGIYGGIAFRFYISL